MRVWAGVENLQNQLFGVAGNLLFIFGLWLVREYFLHVSWRLMLVVTTLTVNVIDMPFTFCTIYDVVRNQYFYLDDALITSIPSAASFIVTTFVIVEVAQPGTEGITYGVLTTAANLGGPVSSGLSNWMYGYWEPSLSDSNNYVEDEPSFRDEVRRRFLPTHCATAAHRPAPASFSRAGRHFQPRSSLVVLSGCALLRHGVSVHARGSRLPAAPPQPEGRHAAPSRRAAASLGVCVRNAAVAARRHRLLAHGRYPGNHTRDELHGDCGGVRLRLARMSRYRCERVHVLVGLGNRE